VIGAIVRAAALPLPGTRDTIPWKIWSFNAAHEGVSRLYGVGGSPAPEWRTLTYAGAEGQATYPPLALHELGLAGRVYRRLNRGRFPNTTPLMITVKAPAAIADCLIAVLIYFVARWQLGERAARWATLAYWLNPGVVLDGEALGYLDPQFMLPILASLTAASAGWGVAAGALGAAAILTKPQAVVVVPIVALALWNARESSATQRMVNVAGAAAGGTAVTAALVVPVFVAGGGPNMIQALGRLAAHDMLSGNATNLWWIVGWLVRVQYTIQDYGVWGAFSRATQILQISRFMQVGYPNPRPIGAVLVLASIAWAAWRVRGATDLWLFSAAAGFSIHAYAALAAQVHENHLYAAVPFLVVAAAGRRRFTPVLVAVSAIVFLNLNLFYGISEDFGYAVPRGLTVIDATVVLSIVNCATLVWYAFVLNAESAAAPNARTAFAHTS
jgi:4-amino-4-deoxy-L-arabinose transferase-like glycosyltransferase